VRYTLKNWMALNRYEDGNLSIDNNATERDIRGVAVGRNNWMFFGSDQGGKTACSSGELHCLLPAGWRRTLRRVQGHPFPHRTHPITRIDELLPHNWKPVQA